MEQLRKTSKKRGTNPSKQNKHVFMCCTPGCVQPIKFVSGTGLTCANHEDWSMLMDPSVKTDLATQMGVLLQSYLKQRIKPRKAYFQVKRMYIEVQAQAHVMNVLEEMRKQEDEEMSQAIAEVKRFQQETMDLSSTSASPPPEFTPEEHEAFGVMKDQILAGVPTEAIQASFHDATGRSDFDAWYADALREVGDMPDYGKDVEHGEPAGEDVDTQYCHDLEVLSDVEGSAT